MYISDIYKIKKEEKKSLPKLELLTRLGGRFALPCLLALKK